MYMCVFICTPAYIYVYGFMCAHTGGTCILVLIYIYIHTHLHTCMCCHRCRFPCAPGLSDGVLCKTQGSLEQTPLLLHIFFLVCPIHDKKQVKKGYFWLTV